MDYQHNSRIIKHKIKFSDQTTCEFMFCAETVIETLECETKRLDIQCQKQLQEYKSYFDQNIKKKKKSSSSFVSLHD